MKRAKKQARKQAKKQAREHIKKQKRKQAKKKEKDALKVLWNLVKGYCKDIRDYANSDTAFTRNRKLKPELLIWMMLRMQGQSLQSEMRSLLRNLETKVTASAFVQAKAKLSALFFIDLFYDFNATMDNLKRLVTKSGVSYGLYAIDGCKMPVPADEDSEFYIDNSESKEEGEYSKQDGELHLSASYDLINKVYVDGIISPIKQANERSAAVAMIKRLIEISAKASIFIMDRGYSGLNVFETLNRLKNAFYLIRIKANELNEIKDLPEEECDVDIICHVTTSWLYYKEHRESEPYLHWVKKEVKKKAKKEAKEEAKEEAKYIRWNHEDDCKVHLRVVKFRINESGKDQWEVLVTNLDRSDFPLADMKGLYDMRWGIETSFRNLKYSVGVVNFHSKKSESIKMEMFAHLIMFNVVNRYIAFLPVKYKTNHKTHITTAYVVNFKQACDIVRQYFRRYLCHNMGDILDEMNQYRNPVRLNRKAPRHCRSQGVVSFQFRVA